MLIAHGLKSLFVSIDAASRETYRAVRGADAFERVVAQVRDLDEQKRALGSPTPRLTLTFVAMRRNIDELPEFVRLARRLGVDRVIADYLIVYSEDMRGQSLFYDQEHSDRVVEEAARGPDGADSVLCAGRTGRAQAALRRTVGVHLPAGRRLRPAVLHQYRHDESMDRRTFL
jgi:MoaA/NifB/PqqE/SkfB family radical SAM enzyme